MPDRTDPAMPKQSPWLFRWFQRYSRKYAARHFHAVRQSKRSHPIPMESGDPLIFVLNHPSWWDLITAFVLSNNVPDYRHFAPIESAMLEKYGIFKRLGLFGIDATPRGAAMFIRTVKSMFSRSHRALWITSQGHFADPRTRPLNLRPGVGAAAKRLESGWVVPVAVEYPFWEERTPEMLLCVGRPIPLGGVTRDAREWTAVIEAGLIETMDVLAEDAMSRDPARFDDLLQGKVGVGGVYDWWRSLSGRLRGRPVRLGHGDTSETSGERVNP